MKFSVKFGLMLIAAISQGSITYAASFDCDKAASPVEKMICSDSQLSELDSQLAGTYSTARTRAADSDQLKHDQREWLKSIRKECQDVACFKDAYTARISALASNQPVVSAPNAQSVLPDADVKQDAAPESQPAPKALSTKQPVKESTGTQSAVATVTETQPTDGKSSKGFALLGGLLLVGLWYLFKSRRKSKTELHLASAPTPVAPTAPVAPILPTKVIATENSPSPPQEKISEQITPSQIHLDPKINNKGNKLETIQRSGAHNYIVHQFSDEIIQGMRSGSLDAGTGLEICRYLRADQNGEFHTAIVYKLEDSDEAAPRMRGAYYGAVGGGDCDGGFFEIEPEEGSCQLLSFDDAESSDESIVFDALMFECARFYNNDEGTYELTDYAQGTLADAEEVGDDRVFMDNDFDEDSLDDIAQQWNLSVNFNGDSDSNHEDEESSESELLNASREDVLQAVSDEGWQLDNVSDEFKDDKEIVLAAVNESGYALQFASEAMRNDKEVVLVAVSNRGSALGSASDDLRNDREVVLAAINSDGDALEHAAEPFKKDATIVEIAVSQSGRALQYAAEQFQGDMKIVILAIENSGSALEYACEALRNHRDIVLAAISNEGAALQYASEMLRSDKEIVQAAISNDGRSIEFASDDIRGDKVFALQAVSNLGGALEYVSGDLRNDKDVVLAAVSQGGYYLQYASDGLKNDRDVVLAAVNESGSALEYASEELRADQEVVDAAVENDEYAREYSRII